MAAIQAQQDERRAKVQAQIDAAAEHAGLVGEILELVAKTSTVAAVRAVLEFDREKARRRYFYIPGDGVPWIVHSRISVVLCHSVRFGGHIRRPMVELTLQEDPPRVIGEVKHLVTLRDMLAQHADNPGAAALAFGKCTLCLRDLTDDESRRRGYGRNCSATYLLPWGAGR